MCSDYLSLSFGCPLLVLASGVFPGFLASEVLNRIRGFRDLHSVNLQQQQPAFISSRRVFLLCSMNCTLSSTVCTCNLPTEQATSVVTDFYVEKQELSKGPLRGDMAHHHFTRSHRVPRARLSDEPLPCDSLRRVCYLVQQRYFLFRHQGLFFISPRHPDLR